MIVQQDNAVEFVDISKAFGNNAVLSNLNLSIPKGKISFIIGRSGDGKSVTLKHIVGIIRPDSGKIFINGMPMHDASERSWEQARKKIGILFQEGALFDSLNVFQNVAFALENHTTMSRVDMRAEVKRLLEIVGLPGIEEEFPKTLSLGEKKRVGLARALALKPELLLYDEPTTSMDPLVSDHIDKLILDMQQTLPHLTSIVVSHDITSVLNIADHVFFLYQGKVYFQGTPDDFRASQDVLVQQFLTGSKQGPLAGNIA